MPGGGTQLEFNGEPVPNWRRWLLYSVGAALLLKIVALLVIKSAFFSAAHEPEVTPKLVDQQLAVEPRASRQSEEAAR